MTKASKVLIIALFLFSVSFFAVAGMNVIISTNWKARADALPTPIKEQQKQLEVATKRIADVEPLIGDARAAITADRAGIDLSVAELTAQLKQRQEQASQLSSQLVDLSRQIKEIRELRTLRRNEVAQLQNQLGELRAQKEQVLAESRRLTDLLYQAQGTLERVTTRKQLLEADGAKVPPPPEAKSNQ